MEHPMRRRPLVAATIRHAARQKAIRIDRLRVMIAIKRAIILLRFDWLTGSIGALLW